MLTKERLESYYTPRCNNPIITKEEEERLTYEKRQEEADDRDRSLFEDNQY